MEKFNIDGTNVCWWYAQAYPKEISIKPLLAIIEAILNNNDEFYCVFDASTYYYLKENNKEEESILSDLVSNFPDNFFMVTGSTRADGVILHDADFNARRIITNDIYKDYREEYLWLADKHNSRLIQGNLQRSGLITIEKLTYGKLNISQNTREQCESIKEKLNPEIISIENEINKRKKFLNEIEEQIKIEKENLRKIFKEIDDCEENILTLENSEKQLNEIIINLIEEQKEYQEECVRLKKKIDKINFVVDFEVVYQEKLEVIGKIEEIIKDKQIESEKFNDKLKLIREEYNKYKFEVSKIEEQKKQEKLKLSNDKECIWNVNKALNEFFEPYRGDIILVNFFDGSSWEVAVKAMDIYFQRHPICENCYEIASFSDTSKCPSCNNGNMTKNPKKIWDIINKFKPKR